MDPPAREAGRRVRRVIIDNPCRSHDVHMAVQPLNREIEMPPHPVARERQPLNDGIVQDRFVKQVRDKRRVLLLEPERGAKHGRLVLPVWMVRIERVVAELLLIDDCSSGSQGPERLRCGQ